MIMDGISVEEFAEIRAEEAYDTGRNDQAKEIAQKMKSMGIPTEQIAEATGLTIEEIEEL